MSKVDCFYVNEISKVPLLTVEEERALAKDISAGKKSAVDKLVLANLRFVLKVANRYKNMGLEMDDLVNEGNIGLMIAAQKFSGSKNTRFTTYAVWWIKACIQKAIREQSTGVKFSAANFREMQNEKWNFASLDKSLNDDDSSLGDIIADDNTLNPEESLILESTKEDIYDGMKNLSPIEKQVLNLRFGLDNNKPKSLSEAGEELGFSKERIRQIEKKALINLKVNLAYDEFCYAA